MSPVRLAVSFAAMSAAWCDWWQLSGASGRFAQLPDRHTSLAELGRDGPRADLTRDETRDRRIASGGRPLTLSVEDPMFEQILVATIRSVAGVIQSFAPPSYGNGTYLRRALASSPFRMQSWSSSMSPMRTTITFSRSPRSDRCTALPLMACRAVSAVTC